MVDHEGHDGCVVVLADGSRCPEAVVLGHYCEQHDSAKQRDIEVFKVLSEHYRQDLREFWSRNNFYLVVDAALVSVYSSQADSAVRLTLGLFGVGISVFWYLVARGSIIWLGRWRREIMQLDELVDRLEVWHRIEAGVKERPWESPSWVTHWLPVMFGLGWLVLLFVGLA
jgi:hypothetical protein